MKLAQIVIAFFMISGVSLIAQSVQLPGQWSLAVSGNYSTNFGVSSSMRGTGGEFEAELAKDYNNSKYPFGDDRLKSMNFGLNLAYRFPESPFGAYLSYSNTYFAVEDWILFSFRKAWMLASGLTAGGEYTLGNIDDVWNTFARAGVSFNLIMGEVTNWGFKTEIKPESRIGFETEFGGRLNIPSTPLALELSANYTNANLFGKSYKKPSAMPPTVIKERKLNDGRNPDNPNDENKTIDFLSLRFGLRIWF